MTALTAVCAERIPMPVVFLLKDRIKRFPALFLRMPSCSSLLLSCPAETLLPLPLWPLSGSSARRLAAFLPPSPKSASVTIAVGGKNLYYYLPMALADWMGFYKDEGLDVKVVDFQGGSKSLQAVVGAQRMWFLERLSTRFRCRPSASPCRHLCFRIVRRSVFCH